MQKALLAKDPVEWLAYKMTEPLDPKPETIGEAHAIIKPLINRAFDSRLHNIKEQNKALTSLILDIEAVSCGEQQIECDGDYTDSDGLLWIYNRIKEFG